MTLDTQFSGPGNSLTMGVCGSIAGSNHDVRGICMECIAMEPKVTASCGSQNEEAFRS